MKQSGLWVGLICCLLLLGSNAMAQGYFKRLDKPGKSFSKKMARLTNGDLILADASLDGLTSQLNRGIFVMRIDPCGEVVWAHTYNWGDHFLKFTDLAVDGDGNIFLYGSAYDGFTELIFLLKLNKNGELQKFGLVHSGTVDHFTLSLDVHNHRLMVFGLLLGWTSQKQGFVLVFDDELNYLWSRKFDPFESVGEAIFTNDNGFLCRSGPYVVKLDAAGNHLWSFHHSPEEGQPIAGPFEVADGYILENHYNGTTLFYKINLAGQLVWKSPSFAASGFGADISILPDGRLLAFYIQNNRLVRLLLSADGNILESLQLSADLPLHAGSLSQSLGANRSVALIINADSNNFGPADASGVLLQFPLDSLNLPCFQWIPVEGPFSNSNALNLLPFQPAFYEAPMSRENGQVLIDSLSYTFTDICDLSVAQVIQKDSILYCGETWLVPLPGSDFRWKDGEEANPRVLELAGVYRAANTDCLLPVVYEYTVSREPCHCVAYLPNAFSPNDDGINETLQLFSNCTLIGWHMVVYNRWGDLVFESDTPENSWNGNMGGRPAEAGVYAVFVRYLLEDETTGKMEDGLQKQDVTLLR